MQMIRTQLTLPDGLLREIDALVGKTGRSAFFTEIAQNALRNRKNGTVSEIEQDLRDVITARKNLKSKVRIPWSVVKRKTGWHDPEPRLAKNRRIGTAWAVSPWRENAARGRSAVPCARWKLANHLSVRFQEDDHLNCSHCTSI